MFLLKRAKPIVIDRPPATRWNWPWIIGLVCWFVGISAAMYVTLKFFEVHR